MKIAFVGKGGSGKTTLSALFVRDLAATGGPVIAVDADINQHLATALGLTESRRPHAPMGRQLPQIKEYLRGGNPRIASAAQWSRRLRPARLAADAHRRGQPARTPGARSRSRASVAGRG